MQLLLCKHDRWLKLLHLINCYTFLFPSSCKTKKMPIKQLNLKAVEIKKLSFPGKHMFQNVGAFFGGGIQNPRLGQIEYLPYFPVLLFFRKLFYSEPFISKPINYWARSLPPRPPKRPNFFPETCRSLAASQLTGAAYII